MTRELIKKTLNLSLEFDTYVSMNPSVLSDINGTAVIVTSANDKELTEANLNIARNSKSGRFTEARKVGKKWKIERVK